ncbi:ATP-binding protein, partial [Symplocastrum sp. BBK-W-15]|nr:ATP-binding protein [Limnofasciculus baicalensis BBK-W-15]
MRIQEITYCDRELEWQFEPIQFSDLTLLVGVSGVGKTQILQSIIDLKKIANGGSFNGIEWDIRFVVKNEAEYRWTGKFETKKMPLSISQNEEEAEKHKFKIINEYLLFNNKYIVERNNNKIVFHGQDLPKLSPFQSVVDILSEEEDIAPVVDGFNKII